VFDGHDASVQKYLIRDEIEIMGPAEMNLPADRRETTPNGPLRSIERDW
jgi:hypothetical protein